MPQETVLVLAERAPVVRPGGTGSRFLRTWVASTACRGQPTVWGGPGAAGGVRWLALALEAPAPARFQRPGARSSVGQSGGLIIRWSQVRSLPGPQTISAVHEPVSRWPGRSGMISLATLVGDWWVLDGGLSTRQRALDSRRRG